MKCPACKKNIPDNSKFCVFCGNRIEEPVDKSKKKDKQQEGIELSKDYDIPSNQIENQKSLNLIKSKKLIKGFAILFSVFFIFSIIMAILFINKKNNYEELSGRYMELNSVNASLEEKYNKMQKDYESLIVRFENLPKNFKEYSSLTGRIEESFELISQQILLIHLLKCTNSYGIYLQKLDEYHIDTHDILLEAYDEYYQKVIKIEQEYRNTCINLERKLANNQISYASYTNNWESEYEKYDNRIKSVFEDYQKEIDPKIEEYNDQISIDYDTHINTLKEADLERDTRLEDLLDKINGLYEYYRIDIPSNGWLLKDDLETFNLQKLSEDYDDEIKDLYYQ